MTKHKALANYNTARTAYDANPNYITAHEVLKAAIALYDISDDYAALLDEADDIMAEPI